MTTTKEFVYGENRFQVELRVDGSIQDPTLLLACQTCNSEKEDVCTCYDSRVEVEFAVRVDNPDSSFNSNTLYHGNLIFQQTSRRNPMYRFVTFTQPQTIENWLSIRFHSIPMPPDDVVEKLRLDLLSMIEATCKDNAELIRLCTENITLKAQ